MKLRNCDSIYPITITPHLCWGCTQWSAMPLCYHILQIMWCEKLSGSQNFKVAVKRNVLIENTGWKFLMGTLTWTWLVIRTEKDAFKKTKGVLNLKKLFQRTKKMISVCYFKKGEITKSYISNSYLFALKFQDFLNKISS